MAGGYMILKNNLAQRKITVGESGGGLNRYFISGYRTGFYIEIYPAVQPGISYNTTVEICPNLQFT